MIGKDTVDTEKILEELEQRYQKIFQKLHKESSFSKGRRSYSNPMKLTNVAITREQVPEFAFVCLARNRETKQLEEYYVSQPYNVNMASDFVDDSVVGYFIFRYIAKVNVWILHSFAEELAQTFVSAKLNIEGLYLRTRENCESKLCQSF